MRITNVTNYIINVSAFFFFSMLSIKLLRHENCFTPKNKNIEFCPQSFKKEFIYNQFQSIFLTLYISSNFINNSVSNLSCRIWIRDFVQRPPGFLREMTAICPTKALRYNCPQKNKSFLCLPFTPLTPLKSSFASDE